MAVPPEVSRLGTLARYVGQAQEFGVGRTVTAEGHDIPTAAVPGTVETLVASGLVDRVVVQDRDGRVFLWRPALNTHPITFTGQSERTTH